MTDSCQIISGNELRRLHRINKLWFVGWVVAAALTVPLIYMIGELRATRRGVAEVARLDTSLREVQTKQELINASYIKAWSLQEKTAEALISWGEFAAEKKSLTNFNNENKPVLTLRSKPNASPIHP